MRAKEDSRKDIEKGNDIYGLEFFPRPDFIFHRNSGLNQVLCKIAKKNNITIGFAFDLFQKAKNKATIFGRMQQNYRLCKKYKVKIDVNNFEKKQQNQLVLESFERLLNKRKLY